MNDTSSRKDDHIEIVKDPECDHRSGQSSFDSFNLNYRSLPEVDFSNVDASCDFLGKRLSFPFYVSPMTGGSENAQEINLRLASAAEEAGVGFGLGSCRALIEDESLFSTFDVRSVLKTVPLIANLGLVQLNYGIGIDDLKRLIDRLNPDALSFHLNPLQEALQPEGDTNFERLIDKLNLLKSDLDLPIILKDVGFGVSSDIVSEVDADYIDVSGRGGTSWSYVEGQRRDDDIFRAFESVGFATADLLYENVLNHPDARFISGGGLRSGVDLFKSVVLGAVVGNAARPLMMAAIDSKESALNLISVWKKQFEISMFVTGVDSYDDVLGNRDLIVKNAK